MCLFGIANFGINTKADQVYITSLDDLKGATIILSDSIDDGYLVTSDTLYCSFESNNINFYSIYFDVDHGDAILVYRSSDIDISVSVFDGGLLNSDYLTITFDINSTFTDNLDENLSNDEYWINWFNHWIVSFTPPTCSSPSSQSVLTEIISLLVGGLTSMATGLGSGLQTMVTSIFVDTSSNPYKLTTFGAIVIVFGAVALAIGLSRWVMNYLTSFGSGK